LRRAVAFIEANPDIDVGWPRRAPATAQPSPLSATAGASSTPSHFAHHYRAA